MSSSCAQADRLSSGRRTKAARKHGGLLARSPATAGSIGVSGHSGSDLPKHTDATAADTELQELCAAFLAVRTSASTVLGEDDLARALQARDSLAGRIRAIPPLSPEGVRTKAQVGLVLLGEGHPPELADDDVGFALTFLRDLATGAPCVGLEVTGLDAELLAACAAFDALEHEAMVLGASPGRIVDDEERRTALAGIVARQAPWLERICEIRAGGPAGWQARARSLALWDREMLADYEQDYTDHRLLAALLRDMAA